jgi:hypothetical protein
MGNTADDLFIARARGVRFIPFSIVFVDYLVLYRSQSARGEGCEWPEGSHLAAPVLDEIGPDHPIPRNETDQR